MMDSATKHFGIYYYRTSVYIDDDP